jgi:hypothetical protein
MRRATIIAAAVAISTAAHAQSFSLNRGIARGIPPSVTSIGASHSANLPPSVTSLRSVPLCCNRAGRPFNFGVGFAFRSAPSFFSPVIVPMAVPVLPMVYDYGMDPLVAPEEVSRIQQRPIRTGYREADYDAGYDAGYDSATRNHRRVAPAEVAERPVPPPVAVAPPEPPKPQPTTVLIFRDGHKIEVQNYAISGTTLYNLSESGPHQVALDDLDVSATTKANSDRGVSFRLPKRT